MMVMMPTVVTSPFTSFCCIGVRWRVGSKATPIKARSVTRPRHVGTFHSFTELLGSRANEKEATRVDGQRPLALAGAGTG